MSIPVTGLTAAQIPGLTAIAGRGIQSSSMEDILSPVTVSGGLNIRVVPATGGTIISIKNETSFGSGDLYIIPEEKSLADEIGKIITLHYLKS